MRCVCEGNVEGVRGSEGKRESEMRREESSEGKKRVDIEQCEWPHRETFLSSLLRHGCMALHSMAMSV